MAQKRTVSVKYFQLFLKVSMVSLFLILGCEENQFRDTLRTPNLSGIKPEAAPDKEERSSSITRVNVPNQLFAFQGDHLYRIHPDTWEIEYYGNGWSGTEAATVYNGLIYAVQGGHLWRCNLSTTACTDLGPNWGGTELLTNNLNGTIYGIQGNKLWKVSASTGYWSQLGFGEWGGASDMVYVYPYIFIAWGGNLWKVNDPGGGFDNYGGPIMNPLVTSPNSWTAYGVYNGKFSYDQISSTGGPTQISSVLSVDLSGATDITHTTYLKQSGGTVHNWFVLKGGVIHHFSRGTTSSVNMIYQGVIPGISNVYRLVSNEGQ